MRRQLKLQGQLLRPHLDPGDEASEAASGPLTLQADGSDSEHCERQQARENKHLWPQADGCAAQRSAEWSRRDGPSSEELRSSSIAVLRAKAREHEAEIHNTRKVSGGDAQTQEAGVRLND